MKTWKIFELREREREIESCERARNKPLERKLK